MCNLFFKQWQYALFKGVTIRPTALRMGSVPPQNGFVAEVKNIFQHTSQQRKQIMLLKLKAFHLCKLLAHDSATLYIWIDSLLHISTSVWAQRVAVSGRKESGRKEFTRKEWRCPFAIFKAFFRIWSGGFFGGRSGNF